MKTVLITGIDGFTGSHLSIALSAAGFRVVGLSNITDDPNNDIFQCDLLDEVSLKNIVVGIQPDYVVHLAAISFVGHGNADDFYRVNVIGTMTLLGILAKLDKKPEKILVASSANIYGNPETEVINEAVRPSPVNHYATSKLAMECMVTTLFDDLPIIITRPFNYTGEGQAEQFLIPKIVSHFRRKEKLIELGNINVSRDFTDVRDVVAAYIALLAADNHSLVVNICSGRAVALADIITMMSGIAGYEIDINVNPNFVRANEIASLHGDNSYLKRLIGFTPQIPLTDTLARMYKDKV